MALQNMVHEQVTERLRQQVIHFYFLPKMILKLGITINDLLCRMVLAPAALRENRIVNIVLSVRTICFSNGSINGNGKNL